MALFRKLFNKKTPEGLLEISERVYVFDCCFSTEIREEKEYDIYIEGIASKLRDQFRDASFMVFNFREGESRTRISNLLSEYDMTVMDYPRQYEGCPLLTTETIHRFLTSSQSWFSLGQQNMILLHSERGGWPVLAFMLTALLLYRKQHSGEQRTLEMIYKRAPLELLQLMSPLNPVPSQLRYLQYVSKSNVGSEWPPSDKALTLDCIILRSFPDMDGEGGCRPIFRIYGHDPFMPTDRTPKVLFSTSKKSKLVRQYKQVECELAKTNIHCHVAGDVVLECINLYGDHERESMMFRIMFNTTFIRSNTLMLNREEIDISWNAKEQFPKDFRTEIIFSDMDVATSDVSIDLPRIVEKDGLPIDGFPQVHELFRKFYYTNVANILQEHMETGRPKETKRARVLHDDSVDEKSEQIIASPTSDALQWTAPSKIISQRVTQSSIYSPVSYFSFLQGSPATLSRYRSASSALGITALLRDHDVSESEDHSHPVEDSDSTPSTALEVSPPAVKSSIEPPPQLPPPHSLHSFSRTFSSPLAKNSLQSLPASSSASLTPPPPPLPKVASSSPQLRTSSPPPPPAPPLQSGSISNTTSKCSVPMPPPPPPPPSLAPKGLSSNNCAPVPPVPPPPAPCAKGLSKAGDISSEMHSVPQPPPPPPPSLAPKGLSSNNFAPVPPVPPPPAPCAKGLSKAGDTSPQMHSVPQPPPPPPPSLAPNRFSSNNSAPVPPPPAPCAEGLSKAGDTSPQMHSVPQPPPPPPPPSHALKGLLSNNSAPVPPVPPPPAPCAKGFSKAGDTSQQMHSVPQPPPPPPPSLVPKGLSSNNSAPVPPVPPPPAPCAKGLSKAGETSTQVHSVPQPPPPPPPSLVPKGLSSNNSAHVPPVPPPPAPCAKGLSKASDTSSQMHSVSNGNIPSIPGPPTGAPLMKGRCISRKKSNLRPYHWLKLSRAIQGSLWAEAQKPEEVSEAPEIDMSELESLFSTAAQSSDNNRRDGKSNRGASGRKPEKVQLIDLRRAYNCEIMLTKVKIPLPDLTSSVLAFDDTTLDADQLENLIKFCPTKEETELLKGYNGDKEKLGKCEQFFLELIKVPRIESKLRVFLFKIQFSSQVSDLRKSLNIVNSAAEEVRNSVKLKRIMQTILCLGNALNRGTARGSAVGFRLDSLLKLTETRAQNNNMTLMHYLCKVLVEKLPELLDFPKDLITLEASTKIQLKCLAEEMQAISKGLEKVVQELSASGNDGPVSETFCWTLKEFLGVAESEVRSLASLYSSVGRNADALALYFGEDPARCPFEQVVATLFNFVRMFIRAHMENCKQIELEKKRAPKEADNEKLKVSSPRKKSEHIK